MKQALLLPLEIALEFVQQLGRSVLFLFQTLLALPGLLARPGLVIQQMYAIGVLSLIIIAISGAFVGMVLGLQGYRTLVDFGAEESLGAVVALSIVRELGPVVTALLFAGRAGSAVAAEIGLMRATEQLDGMAMMAVDPIKRIVAPRFLAGFLCMPLLTAIFSLMAIGVVGGYLVGVQLLGVDSGAYWSQIQSTVEFEGDILNGIVKSFVFGAAVSWIAVYQGYHAAPTAEGVSRATTSTVVVSSLVILGLDFILTSLMFGGV
ncbi:MAG: lipid asymmetry maintenance ABC transporter permease subunit MlaE [Nevskiales bacterium]